MVLRLLRAASLVFGFVAVDMAFRLTPTFAEEAAPTPERQPELYAALIRDLSSDAPFSPEQQKRLDEFREKVNRQADAERSTKPSALMPLYEEMLSDGSLSLIARYGHGKCPGDLRKDAAAINCMLGVIGDAVDPSGTAKAHCRVVQVAPTSLEDMTFGCILPGVTLMRYAASLGWSMQAEDWSGDKQRARKYANRLMYRLVESCIRADAVPPMPCVRERYSMVAQMPLQPLRSCQDKIGYIRQFYCMVYAQEAYFLSQAVKRLPNS
jgi:hypothetical protein